VKSKLTKNQLQSGQTLIETLVAAFILVMGMSAALGLATYSLGATTNIRQETVAMGLAREGIEVVKNIRDTNWLKGSLSTTCYDFMSEGSSSYCYQDWLNPAGGQDMSPGGSSRNFFLKFDTAQSNPWRLTPTTTNEYGLNISNFPTSGFTGVYYIGADGLQANESNSGFARAITISQDTFSPFNRNTGPRLKVTVDVWWNSKGCPTSLTPPTDSRCAVKLETYLTNWKNF
jgi:type II secretory pathway pseudopilin PulG